ncbi:DUF6894 family protein [Methylobacterium phyllosphaerae]
MPIRFYFDVENGKETIRDEQGVEAEDASEALEESPQRDRRDGGWSGHLRSGQPVDARRA